MRKMAQHDHLRAFASCPATPFHFQQRYSTMHYCAALRLFQQLHQKQTRSFRISPRPAGLSQMPPTATSSWHWGRLAQPPERSLPCIPLMQRRIGLQPTAVLLASPDAQCYMHHGWEPVIPVVGSWPGRLPSSYTTSSGRADWNSKTLPKPASRRLAG